MRKTLGFPPGLAGLLAAAAVAEAAAVILFLTFNLVYFATYVGIPAVHVGAVLTVSGCLGIVVGVPAARLVERFGSHWVLVGAVLGQALGTGLYALAGNLIAYAAITFVLTVCERTAYAARGAVMSVVLVGEKRSQNRAKVRSLCNAAAILAALVGSAVLQVNRHWMYLVAIGCVAVLFLFSAGVSLRLPDAGRVQGGGSSRLVVVRDKPFLGLTAVNTVLTMHFGLFEILPLWIVRDTQAPRWMGGALFLLNATTVVFFQVRAGRKIDHPRSAGRAMRRAGAFLCGACVLFGLAGRQPYVAVVLLLCAGLVYVWAEMLHAAAGWELSFGLAQQDRHAQYQAMYGTGATLGTTLAPLVATSLVLGTGTVGWICIGLLFLLTGAATPPLVRQALRSPLRTAPAQA
ncbi:MFS transporter [Streptomyces canus]|uniref:MFS transporter n=1 Tax=Streptomyces canus TaxID=58343 RepID=UPI00225BDAFD|nr:MFS transporter [Streptomyces canus]MCX5256836.1 MFS transporter [Streptomyces canus]